MLLLVQILLGLSFVVSVVLAFFAWQRRSKPGALEFTILMWATAEWALTYALEIGLPDFGTKIFWAKVEYFGVVSMPVFWLILAVRYAGWEKWLSPRNQILVSIVPALTLVLIWTNGFHHLMWSEVGLDTSGPFPALVWTRGWWFWLFTVYNYALLLVGTVLLVGSVFRSKEVYRGQVRVLLVGVVIPWIGSILYLLGFDLFGQLLPTPVLFTVTGLALAWGLFRFQLLDIVPVAHEAVLQSMSDAVIVLDADDRIVDLNLAAQNVINVPASEAVGTLLTEVMSVPKSFVERLSSSPAASEELAFPGESGRERIFDPRLSPLYNRRDSVVGRLLVLRDITDRKRMEEALRLARDQALESSRMKSRFLANVSHELRTPLGSILGFSEFLREGTYGPVSERQGETLDKIIESTKYLSEMVNELLTQSQIEAGKITLNMAPFSVREMVEQVRSKSSIYANNKGLWLSIRVSSDVPDEISGDERKIEQILLILVSNAIKFTSEGEVKIDVYRHNARNIAWQVSDTGPGISEDMRDKIFEPFHRVDESVTRESGGVGLGLAIVEQLVLLMGGRIELETQLGEGSTFRVLLPASFGEEALS